MELASEIPVWNMGDRLVYHMPIDHMMAVRFFMISQVFQICLKRDMIKLATNFLHYE